MHSASDGFTLPGMMDELQTRKNYKKTLKTVL